MTERQLEKVEVKKETPVNNVQTKWEDFPKFDTNKQTTDGILPNVTIERDKHDGTRTDHAPNNRPRFDTDNKPPASMPRAFDVDNKAPGSMMKFDTDKKIPIMHDVEKRIPGRVM